MHVRPTHSKKMKVSLAAQVLSRSTSAAMETLGEELSPTAKNTAAHLAMFNAMFDFFNSRNLKECGTRKPVIRQLWEEQKSSLDRWFLFVQSISFKGARQSKRTLPFKEGWLISLAAVKCLLSDVLEEDEVSFVLTRRINQDAVEVSTCT